MLSFRSLLTFFLVAALATSTLAAAINNIPRSHERCGACEAEKYPLSVLIPQVHDTITPLVHKMKSLPPDEITAETLGPIADDIKNALDDLVVQLQLFIDQNVSLDLLLHGKSNGSKVSMSQIGIAVASLISTIVGGINAIRRSASSGNLASVTHVLMDIVVTLVTVLLRLGTLLIGLLTTPDLVSELPELVKMGLEMGVTDVLGLVRQLGDVGGILNLLGL